MSNSHGVIRLSPSDNVVVAIRNLSAGETIDGLAISQPVPIGFKVAGCAIAPGEKIIKWGAPIGSAISEIRPGEIVHLHNMKSDYLPTYTLDGAHRFVAAPAS